MKYYKNLVDAVIEVIADTETYPADKVIERILKRNKKWGARDRRFVAENIYEIVRWKKLLQAIALEKHWLSMWQALLVLREQPLPEFYNLNEIEVQKIRKNIKGIKARDIRQSVEIWFDDIGLANWPKKWDSILSQLNRPAPVFLRPNLMKTSASELCNSLRQEGIEAEGKDGALMLKRRQNVFRTECFKKGWFEVQDLGSQKIAVLLDPQPGERIVDACAGAGGKSLHIADLMKNQGKIIALDIHEKKLGQLKLRARRAGVSNIESKLIDGRKTIKRLAGQADRVLLDVPCSGSGVLRRNPDSKWKLNVERFQELLSIQRQIIFEYSYMLKKQGTLVYSTCSIFSEENEKIVEDFLAHNAEFKLIEQITLLPEERGGDGFFMAKLTRE